MNKTVRLLVSLAATIAALALSAYGVARAAPALNLNSVLGIADTSTVTAVPTDVTSTVTPVPTGVTGTATGEADEANEADEATDTDDATGVPGTATVGSSDSEDGNSQGLSTPQPDGTKSHDSGDGGSSSGSDGGSGSGGDGGGD